MPAETKIRHRDRYHFANVARYDARDLIGCLDPIGLDCGTSRLWHVSILCLRPVGFGSGNPVRPY